MAKKSIKKSEDLYENIYKFSRDAIMLLEPPAWNFTMGNPAAIKMFGCKNEKEFISRSPGDFSPIKQPDGEISAKKAKSEIEKAIKKGSNFFDWEHKKFKGKTFYASVLLTKFKKNGKNVLQATVRDISKEKKIEIELNQKIEELEKFNKIAIKRELKMIEMKKLLKKYIK